MIGDIICVYGRNNNMFSDPHWYVRKVTADWLVDMVRREANDKKLNDYGIVIPEQQSFVGDTKPIPLTEEILKTNGFKSYIGWPEIYHIYNQIGYDVEHQCLCKMTRGLAEPVCYISYVHEFQHALRMLGLWKKAESFEVTM